MPTFSDQWEKWKKSDWRKRKLDENAPLNEKGESANINLKTIGELDVWEKKTFLNESTAYHEVNENDGRKRIEKEEKKKK